MSRDISVNIYLPLPKLDVNKVYTSDELKDLSQYWSTPLSRFDKYFIKLKVEDIYASKEDVSNYLKKKYNLVDDDFENCVISYKGYADEYEYILGDRHFIITKDIEDMLKKGHINEYWYINPYSCYSTNYYGNISNGLYEFTDAFMHKLIKDRFDRYKDYGETEIESLKYVFEEDSLSDSDKVIVKALIAKEMAKKVKGKTFIEID